MTTFQIVTIILSTLALLGSIIFVYVKLQIDITRLQTIITFFQRDLDNKEKAILLLEQKNTKEHDVITSKIDQLINKN